MARYNLYFSGRIYPDRQEEDVRRDLARMLKLDDAQVTKLFSGRKVLIKRNLPESDLPRYEQALKQAGAQIIVEPVSDEGGLSLTPMEPKPAPAPSAPSPADTESPDPYGAPASTISGSLVYCRGCGQRIHESASQCPYCGARQETGAPRSKVVAGVLGILLGGLGAHRLYLGQWWGLLYIILPFSSLVALVEGIVFLATPDARWLEKYGRVKENLVWLLAPAVVVGVAMIGILAAVAIPAYQDYTVRSRVAATLSEAEGPKGEVREFVRRTGILPDSNVMLGYPEPLALSSGALLMVDDEGRLEITFGGELIDDQTLLLTPQLENGDVVDWRCGGGTLPARYRPSACRNDLEQAASPTPRAAVTEWRQVQPDHGQYQVTVPQHWNRLRELEDNASQFAFGNKFREQYLLVMTEPALDFDDSADHRVIAEAFLDNMQYNMTETRWSALDDVMLAGYPGTAFDLHGKVDGLAISYRGATFRTDDQVFYVMCWTMTSEFDRFRGTCVDVMDSLQLAGPAPAY